MRRLHSIRFLVVFCMILLPACGGDFINNPDITTDPNRAPDVTSDVLFNSVQVVGFMHQESQVARQTSMWMQQMAGTDRQFIAYGQYSITESVNTFDMNAYYTGGGLIDIRRIINEQDSVGNRGYAGVAKVWEALNMGTAASVWGDLPYSEAVSEVTTPRLDSQSEIYASLQRLLDEAIADLENSGPTDFPPNEFVYNGDASRWIRAAHTLKARLYMHWAEVDAGNYSRAMAEARQGIKSPDGNFLTQHSESELEASVWAQFQRARDTYQRGGRYMIDLLVARSDPRLPIYFAPDDAGGYSGADPGENRIDVSNLSETYLSRSHKSAVMTWAETRLIIAECLFKTGDEAGALDELNAVRRGTEQKWGIADGSLGVAVGLTGDALIDAIMEEKYIALFLNIESWNDWKRTNRPVLSGADRIPRRLFYSEVEKNTNPNIPSVPSQPLRNANDPGDSY